METKVRRGAHPQMIEVEKTSPPKLRKLYAQCVMSTGLDYRVHNHSFQNLRRGLLERVFYVEENKKLVECPKPSSGAFKQMKYLADCFGDICGHHTRISAEEFVDCY